MPKTVSDSESMRVEIVDFVRHYPDRFREAGVWLDREYSVAQCLERDLAFYPENYSGELPTLESWQSKILRLRSAVRDLLADAPYADKANPRVPPSLDPYHYRVLLVEWLCVDPESFTLKPPLTEFQDLACGKLPHDLMHCTTDSFDSEAWRKLCRGSLKVVRCAVDKQPPLEDKAKGKPTGKRRSPRRVGIRGGTPRQKTAMDLKEHGFTHAQIAEEMGLKNESSVTGLLQRGKAANQRIEAAVRRERASGHSIRTNVSLDALEGSESYN